MSKIALKLVEKMQLSWDYGQGFRTDSMYGILWYLINFVYGWISWIFPKFVSVYFITYLSWIKVSLRSLLSNTNTWSYIISIFQVYLAIHVLPTKFVIIIYLQTPSIWCHVFFYSILLFHYIFQEGVNSVLVDAVVKSVFLARDLGWVSLRDWDIVSRKDRKTKYLMCS